MIRRGSRATIAIGLLASVALLVSVRREHKQRVANDLLSSRIVAVAALRDSILDFALAVGDPVPPLRLRLIGGNVTTLRDVSRDAGVLYFENERCPACSAIRPHIDSLESRFPGLILRVEYEPRGRDSTSGDHGRPSAIAPNEWRRYLQYTPTVVFVGENCAVDGVVHGSSDRVLRALAYRLQSKPPRARRAACLDE